MQNYRLSVFFKYINRGATSGQEVDHVWLRGRLISLSLDRKQHGGPQTEISLFFFTIIFFPLVILQEQKSCSVQKNAGKNTQYSRKSTIVKIDHFRKSISHAKWPVWVQFFFAQKHAENDSKKQQSCSVQKPAGKNTQYSRNETILKINHFGQAIAHAKCPVLVQFFFAQKHAENDSTRTIELFCTKNRWKKYPIFQK